LRTIANIAANGNQQITQTIKKAIAIIPAGASGKNASKELANGCKSTKKGDKKNTIDFWPNRVLAY
jgi:hypothetical protein